MFPGRRVVADEQRDGGACLPGPPLGYWGGGQPLTNIRVKTAATSEVLTCRKKSGRAKVESRKGKTRLKETVVDPSRTPSPYWKGDGLENQQSHHPLVKLLKKK